MAVSEAIIHGVKASIDQPNTRYAPFITPAGGWTGTHSAAIPTVAPTQATPSIQPDTGASRASSASGVEVVANMRKMAV